MDVISDCFFENFPQLERNSLYSREKRRDMAEYFGTLIEGCSRGEGCDPQKTCREAIVSILRFHEKSLRENGRVCLKGNYHNILYVALKLCFDWQLKDTPTVSELLGQIYLCEGCFDRIWVGALFGSKPSHVFSAWRPDFDRKEENFRAAVFLADHSNKARAQYTRGWGSFRFTDAPLNSFSPASPFQVAVQHRLADTIHVLLRFGARIEEPSRILEDLLWELSSHGSARSYSYNLINCLRVLMRALTGIFLEPPGDFGVAPGSNGQKEAILQMFPHLIEDRIVPVTRSGLEPPELKHLCRCCVRHRLWQNYQLPNGIRMLPVPECLRKYLDLLLD